MAGNGRAGRSETRSARERAPNAPRRLTQTDRTEIFRIATTSFADRYGDRFAAGMTDDELSNVLRVSLGTFGGSGGPDRPSVSITGSGLRIWGGWHVVNRVVEKPPFAGKTTIAMAREVYSIVDPDNKQLDLF